MFCRNSVVILITGFQGCFLHEECIGQPRCVEKAYAPRNNVLFCCCDGDMCNQNYTWEPEPTEPPPPSTPSGRCYGINWTISLGNGLFFSWVSHYCSGRLEPSLLHNRVIINGALHKWGWCSLLFVVSIPKTLI